MDGWIGVDLDGTLAHYDEWVSVDHIGEPIEPMRARVLAWLMQGRDVRIFTARVSDPAVADQAREAIDRWCEEHLGRTLPITNQKDYGMVELWDDRCVQVVTNEGRRVAGRGYVFGDLS